MIFLSSRAYLQYDNILTVDLCSFVWIIVLIFVISVIFNDI